MFRDKSLVPGLAFAAVALVFATVPALAADGGLTVETVSDDTSASTASAGDTKTSNDSKTRYVVRDEVFVDEEAPTGPSSGTIAAKLPLPLDETPVSVGTVGEALIDQQDGRVLGDALRNVSGVHAQTGNGLFDVFTLRGLDSSANGLILTDGAPEPQTAFFHLYNVERVEVLKGPSSFLYGGFSMAGAVNLVRKSPKRGTSVGFGVEGGSDATWEGRVDANYGQADSWGLRVNGLWRQSDGYRDGRDYDVVGVNPTFAFRPSDRTSIHVSLEQVSTDASPDAGLPLFFGSVPDVPRRRSYQSPYDLSEQDTQRFQVDVESHLSDALVLRNKTYFRNFDWLSKTTIFNGAFPNFVGSVDVYRSLLILDDNQDFVGNQFEVLWRVGEGVRHNLLFGVDVARLSDEFTFDVGYLPTIDLFAPQETAQGPIFVIPGQSFGTDARSDVVAPYVVDQIHFSEKVQLLLGARWDSIDFEDSLIGLTRSDSKVSPMLGVVVSPSATFSIYANAGEAFSPQSTFVVGQNREPEEAQQVELGLRHRAASGKVETTLALFDLERKNVAIPDQTGVTRQTGTQDNQGVEFQVTLSPHEGLRGTLTYTYTDAELTKFDEFAFDPFTNGYVFLDHAGNTAPFAPEHVADLWISQTFANGFGIAGGGHYTSEQFIAADNAFAIDSVVTVDAAMFFDRHPWRFQVNLKNLTDEETYQRAFYGSSVVPAPGFTATVGIHYAPGS